MYLDAQLDSTVSGMIPFDQISCDLSQKGKAMRFENPAYLLRNAHRKNQTGLAQRAEGSDPGFSFQGGLTPVETAPANPGSDPQQKNRGLTPLFSRDT